MSHLLRLVRSSATVLGVGLAQVATWAAVPAAGAPVDDPVTYTERREVCANRTATRRAYFGDLHVHTGFSYDARPFGAMTTPADAYRFAKGEPIGVPPYDADGLPQARLQLGKRLDFAAVTDHAEFFGELALCTDPASAVYEAAACAGLRSGAGAGMLSFVRVLLARKPERLPEICGASGAACSAAAPSVWQVTRDMAEAAYDRSSRCEFTSFVAYEYTGTTDSNNYHRNVIFRNQQVPERPISYVEAPDDRELWAQLSVQCLDGVPGCDVLAIPHNSNLSTGSMFRSYIGTGAKHESARQLAKWRNAMEPVMEIFQHKGNSECFNGLPGILGGPDELCDMEQVLALGERTDRAGEKHTIRFCADDEAGTRGFSRLGCISRNDFFRSVLLTGLQDRSVIGINSYRLGAIGSTDTHISAPGATDERGYRGHLVDEAALPVRLGQAVASPRNLDANPGGLAGIWAVENSRDALFEALRRREVFGTTGTRIRPRLFGGWNFDQAACSRGDLAAYGYARGVPMGGDLGARQPQARATFIAAAVKDPDGAPLQKLQLIKGWVDATGALHYRVFDVAGSADDEAAIDLETGQWRGAGAPSLCAVFTDPEFDPAQPAYYYLRAVEVPSLRWSWAQCAALPAARRPAACENSAPKTLQELAWTSPIWYAPDETG